MGSSVAAIQSIVTWALVLITTVLFLAGGIWAVRRWLLRRNNSEAADTGWSLQQLREMRDAAQISESEFNALKAQLTSAVRRKVGPADSATQELTDSRPGGVQRNQIKRPMEGSR